MIKVFYVLMAFQMVAWGCSVKKEEKVKDEPAVAIVNEYPDLSLTLQDGTRISTRSLQGKNMFVFFQPECDHCQQEAAEIQQQLNSFKDYTLYFISSAPLPQVIQFSEDYGLNNKQNIKFAVTSSEGVLTHYGPIQTPSVYIYSEGRLKKSFNGQTKVDNILNNL